MGIGFDFLSCGGPMAEVCTGAISAKKQVQPTTACILADPFAHSYSNLINLRAAHLT